MLIGVSNTYFKYRMIASQLHNTYLCACSFSRSVKIKLDGLSNDFPIGGKKEESCPYKLDSRWSWFSSFLDGLLCFVEKPSRYLEQNTIHSSATNEFAIEASGWALLRTYDFSLHRYLQHMEKHQFSRLYITNDPSNELVLVRLSTFQWSTSIDSKLVHPSYIQLLNARLSEP